MADTVDDAARRSPQQERSRATVERIVVAADAMFAECGLSGTSTTMIAQRAGLSVGALYRFFPDKDRIAFELVQRYLTAANERFEPILAAISAPADVPDAVAGLIDAAADLQLDHRGYYRLSDDLNPRLAQSPAHPSREALLERFERALGASGLSAGPAHRRRQVVELCIETVRHTLARCPHDSPERPTIIRELTAMITAYITAGDEAPE